MIEALSTETVEDGTERVQFDGLAMGFDRGWVSVTAKGGTALLELIRPLDFTNGPLKFSVLATCTVRDGPDADTAKVGEHKEGTVIDVVQEAENTDGLKVYQTITAPEGANRGGWVKLKTSKGKELLDQVHSFTADEPEEEKAPDPKEPPRDLVAITRYYAKLDKVKVKVTIDGAGIYVVEDTKEAKKVCSYSTRRVASWNTKGKSGLRMVAVEADKSERVLVFSTKEAEQMALSMQQAVMAACAWKVDAEAWKEDGLTVDEMA